MELSFKDIQKNKMLAPYTSFRIGGAAEFFFEAKNEQALGAAFLFAKKEELPFTVLGGGQNVLISDKGILGLVVLNRAKKIERLDDTKIVAASGVTVGELLSFSAKEGLEGLAWAAGLPGTVGGSVFGNSGTFGSSFADTIESVSAITNDGDVKRFSRDACAFGYKTSLFKTVPHAYLLLSAIFLLKHGDSENIRKEIERNLKWRATHHPPYQSAGCIFKNPELLHYHRLAFDVVGRPHHHNSFVEGCLECAPSDVHAHGNMPQNWFEGHIPAGWLIDRAGLKGRRVGDAVVSLQHANFIMNMGKARAEDVIILIGIVKEAVHRQFGVMLEEEIRYLGFENSKSKAQMVKTISKS